jgi:hypothetical protein
MEYQMKCPCCGYYSLYCECERNFNICPVCYWEDDPLQFLEHDYWGGANKPSLNQAKRNFLLFGAVEERLIRYTRKPLQSELVAPWGEKERVGQDVPGIDSRNAFGIARDGFSAVGKHLGDTESYHILHTHPYFPPFEMTFGCDFDETTELEVADGLLPIIGKITGDDPFNRTVRIWIENHRLRSIEIAWKGDSPPDRWPFADELAWREIQDEDLNPYDL